MVQSDQAPLAFGPILERAHLTYVNTNESGGDAGGCKYSDVLAGTQCIVEVRALRSSVGKPEHVSKSMNV